MNVDLHLAAPVEQALIRRAQAEGKDLAMVVEEVVTEAVADELDQSRNAEKPKSRQGTFRERLEAWVSLHPVLDREIDDSRESIYEGRGE